MTGLLLYEKTKSSQQEKQKTRIFKNIMEVNPEVN